MTKNFTDKNTYNLIISTLKKYGINDDILKLAKRMNVNVVRLFYEKILCVNDKNKLYENIQSLTKTLLGVYGNYIVTCYYKALGYEVKNEYPVYDSNGELLTRADLAFVDNLGNLNLCEVKATTQIIDNIRNYNSNNEEKYNGKFFYDMDSDIIKYKEIGTKLIKQVSKLKKTGSMVIVSIFDGCFMDDIIKDKLEELGVTVVKMASNIEDLEAFIEECILSFCEDLKTLDGKINKI